jgi:hypothetical protein
MRSDFFKRFISGMAIAVLSFVPALRAQQRQVPVGTSISVSLNQSVSSKDAQAGQKLSGRVAAAVVVNGKTLIPKGAKVNLSVASVRMAGPMSAPAKLLLQIDSIEVNKTTLAASSSLSGQDDQREAANRSGSNSGELVDASGSDKGELVGASAGSENGITGNRQRDITLAAKAKLRFTLRTSVEIR